MDLLTPTVNVPAERAKLRRLRDEIAADVAAREAYAKRYTRRGYPRLPDMRELETEREQRDGKTSLGPVRVETGMDVPSAAADVREASAGCRGCGRCSCGVGQEGVK